MNDLSDGLIVIAKRDCPTCLLVEPLLRELAESGQPLSVLVQGDEAYAAGLPGMLRDDTLERSYRLQVEFVPTLIRMADGREVERTYGWHRGDWQRITGLPDLGAQLPEVRPGCASKTLDPGLAERLELRFGEHGLQARQIEIGDSEDPIEACFERGWSDGLPGGAADPRARAAHAAAGHHAPARRSARPDAAGPRALQCREGCGQCGHGRLQAGIPERRAGRGRGRAA